MSALISYRKNLMVFHEVTGTYLETDNYTTVINSAVQTWHEFPPKTAEGLCGHLWTFTPVEDTTKEHNGFDFFISSSQPYKKNPEEYLYLTASANTPKEFNAAYPRLQTEATGIKLLSVFRPEKLNGT